MGPTASPPAAPPAAVDIANRLRPVLLHLARHLHRYSPSPGVTAGQLEILGLLSRHPGVGINELAGLVGIAAPSMSNAVDKLEAAGLAARSREGSGDRRRVGVSVTPEGSRVVRAARSSRTAWLAERLARLTPEQRAGVDAAIDALEAIASAPPQGGGEGRPG
jgi:DNA-binding MarR family transcriptional regulator